jgi:hypothetical protein
LPVYWLALHSGRVWEIRGKEGEGMSIFEFVDVGEALAESGNCSVWLDGGRVFAGTTRG